MDEKRRIEALEWAAWAGLAISSFAILEHRAIKSQQQHPTLSHVLRKLTRTSKRRTAVSAALYGGGATWLAYHLWLEELA